ncbi:MAG: N-6 DNA methylase [Clostridiales bacterium]|nr:N-6 DNA methylase [Clostridiales bacterium]
MNISSKNTVSPPLEGYEKQESNMKLFTIDDLCKLLSISKATAKNWIRLGKLTPDIDNYYFSQTYVSKIITDIKSQNNTKLKSRRNKKNATGRAIYKDYIHTSHNQHLMRELLDLDIIHCKEDLCIILANFAVQQFYQRNQIIYTDNNVLVDFWFRQKDQDFYALISDLLNNQLPDTNTMRRLQPVLSKELLFIPGEDSLGFIYISFKDISQRKRSGVYYTPETIVNKLIKNLNIKDEYFSNKLFCDPCCGTGNFLLCLAAKGICCSNLYGQDIDPISVYLTRINLALFSPKIQLMNLYSHIRIGNSLFDTFEQKFDIILGNPPWGSNFTESEIIRLRDIFQTACNNTLEAYDLFVEKALSMLRTNGILAFVLPEAILNVSAHHIIRKILIASCSFQFVCYLGNVFSGVQCPAVILGVSLDHANSIIGCKVSLESNTYIINQKREYLDRSFSFHISDEEYECLKSISKIRNVVYLKENAQFALGIVTGNNKEFLIKEQKEGKEGYEIILKGSDIYRYKIKASNNYIRFSPESFQQVAPTELYRAKEKLLYRFISEVPVFAYDNNQTLSLNSCNILIPKIPELHIKYILAILNSKVAAFYFLKKFRSIKHLRSHIEQIPIPVVSTKMQNMIVKKVDCIMNSSGNIQNLYTSLDDEIMKLYHLTNNQITTIQSTLKGKNLFL